MSWVWGVPAFLLGAMWWTVWEYGLHRFMFHERRGRNLGSRLHLDHHARATWIFDPHILLAWFGVLLTGVGWAWAATQVSSLLLDVVGTDKRDGLASSIGIGFGAGWTVHYFFYEWHHRAAHLRAPKNRWERFVRKHHLHHHFGHPMRNQGVTVNWWDRVAGTLDQPDVVRVPRRLAPRWMLDTNGEILAAFRDDYILIGQAVVTAPDKAAEDHDRAYANLVPLP
ncbi:MAG: sterol desaturase family protein [Actinobacteria bacterium]|nr:sterol desaturase family protein [Actinomycetota bacterium]MCB9389746.1 sterol desaturase family protein [Acidimicrobiia bacterium]